MSFLDKKSLLIVVIVLIVAVIGFVIGFGGLFYWHKINVPADNPSEDISQEEIKAKCIENANKMADEELINEVKDLEYIEEVALADEESKLNLAIDQTAKYLNCKLADNKDEKLYNIAKSFIQGLMIQEESKEKHLRLLDDAYSDKSKNTFTIQLALGDLNQICPTRLQELCIENYKEENIKGVCHDYCKLINDYQIDDDRFNREIMNYSYWSQYSLLGVPVTDVTSNRVTIRLAIVLRLKGEDTVKQFCQSLPETRLADIKSTIRNFCLERLDTILKKKSVSCEKLREEIFELICTILE